MAKPPLPPAAAAGGAVAKRGRIKRVLWAIPVAYRGAKQVHDAMSAEQRAKTLHFVRNPQEWREAIENGWDVAKVNALELGAGFAALAKIAAGRKTSKDERRVATDGLALAGTVVPPLRVFMVPGAHHLLGVVAFVLPWKLIPDKWIPIKALRGEPEIFEGMDLGEDGLPIMPKAEKRKWRLFKRSQRKAIDLLDD